MAVLGGMGLVVSTMFLVNLLGQLWEPLLVLRPLTVFYYYQPQEPMLGIPAVVNLSEWYGPDKVALPGLWVLVVTGALGYAAGTWRFATRDLPAPL
jgi:ABC-2 type transport system permease protein